jgi:serine/threonine protein phosphatase 1
MANPTADPDDDDDAGSGEDLGSPPSTGGALAYVIGPVHGQLGLLRDLVAILVADALAAKPTRRPQLIFMGDYLGGGSGAPGVLAFILDLKTRPIFKVHALQGRDDRALLNFLEWPAADARWMVEGDGAAVLQSFGIAAPSPRANAFAWNDAAEAFRAVLPEDHLVLLKSLETLVSIGDYAFVHGGLRPEPAGRNGALEEIQWIRGSPFRQGYTVEHANPKGVRPKTGALQNELFALRIQDTRQVIFQAAD